MPTIPVPDVREVVLTASTSHLVIIDGQTLGNCWDNMTLLSIARSFALLGLCAVILHNYGGLIQGLSMTRLHKTNLHLRRCRLVQFYGMV
jgi:hypothetical protein